MSDTVKIKLTAWSNISYNTMIDTRIEQEEWDAMTFDERDEVAVDAILSNVAYTVLETNGTTDA